MRSFLVFFPLIFFMAVEGQPPAKNKWLLPKTNKSTYLPVPTALENIFFDTICQDSLIKDIKYYHTRLTAFGQYDVYSARKNCSNISTLGCLCDGGNQLELELLVFYDRQSKRATVIVGAFSFLSDSEVYNMTYKMHGRYITLTESGVTEGEGGKAETFSKRHHTISILQSGALAITHRKGH